jgi:nicotinamidase-related amidase
MIVLLIVDMQVGLFEGHPPRHDADGVVQRINAVARAVRAAGGGVVFIQHDDPRGGVLEPETAGWKILPVLERTHKDPVVRKRACDSFYETGLQDLLEKHGARQLIVTGCATDFCVDTTVRAAASRDYEVVVVADGHTTKDRPHLDAVSIIRHHNWMWENLILPTSQVKVLPAASIVSDLISNPTGARPS